MNGRMTIREMQFDENLQSFVNVKQLSIMAKCKPERINRLISLKKIKPDAVGRWGNLVVPLWEEENAWSIAHRLQTLRELREEFAL